MRDVGLGLVDRMPALKSFFIREAAGVTGEVPKLLRGRGAVGVGEQPLAVSDGSGVTRMPVARSTAFGFSQRELRQATAA